MLIRQRTQPTETALKPCKQPVEDRNDQRLLESIGSWNVYLNLALVLGRDLLSLNFLCCSDEAALRCPLVWCEDHHLKNLNRLEAVLLANSIALLEYDARDRWVCAKRMEVSALRVPSETGRWRVGEVMP